MYVNSIKMVGILWLLANAWYFGPSLNAQNATEHDTLSIQKILEKTSPMYGIPKEHRDYFNSRKKIEVSKEIIAELRKHKVYTFNDHLRTLAAHNLFSSLELPEEEIIAELDKGGTPFEKFQFIQLLQGRSDSAATQALLRQLGDKRIVDQEEIAESPHRIYRRVCDWALRTISYNLTGDYGNISELSSDSEREKVIEETLQKLNLKVPDVDKKK
jgi:hypothetical protein